MYFKAFIKGKIAFSLEPTANGEPDGWSLQHESTSTV